jgi:hypothetical protein
MISRRRRKASSALPLTSEPRGRVDIQVGAGRRRRWSDEAKGRIVADSYAPGAVDVTITPEDINCPCCRAPMHVIGEETSQRLDVVPVQFQVIVTHRSKYACRACEEAVVQAPAPERLIKGGPPTKAMVAYASRLDKLMPWAWAAERSASRRAA